MQPPEALPAAEGSRVYLHFQDDCRVLNNFYVLIGHFMTCPHLPTLQWVVSRLSGWWYSLAVPAGGCLLPSWFLCPGISSLPLACSSRVLSCGLWGSEAVASVPGLSALSVPRGATQAVPPTASTVAMGHHCCRRTATQPAGRRSRHPLLGYLNFSWY